MNTGTKTGSRKTWWALAGLVSVLGWAGRSQAANPAYLNINVSITQNLSVSVSGVGSSTHTTNWNTGTANAKLVSAATATVTNDSGAQTERWQLSTNASSINTAAGADAWTLSTDSSTVGSNQFALQAVFGSSNTAAAGCPVGAAADWNQSYAPEVTSTPTTYTSSVFAGATLTNGGGTPNPDVAGSGRMYAGSFRALCWRVVTPSSTDTTDTQNIQLIVTAIAP